MKATLSIPQDMMPPDRIHQRVFEMGARARLEGKLMNSNPYNILGRGGFWISWIRGWVGADTGDIRIQGRA